MYTISFMPDTSDLEFDFRDNLNEIQDNVTEQLAPNIENDDNIFLTENDRKIFNDTGFMKFVENSFPVDESNELFNKTKENLYIQLDAGNRVSFTEFDKNIKESQKAAQEKEEEVKENKESLLCTNCGSTFEPQDFPNHVCEKQKPSADNALVLRYKQEIIEFKESTNKCLRLLRENQIRHRRFLKDELKFDINVCITQFGEASKIFNDKKYGPHECTLCERKFVHASGLLRHMEKHELDLIPTSTGSRTCVDAETDKLELRVVLGCCLCGRTFLTKDAANNHLNDHFSKYAHLQKKHKFDQQELESTQFTSEVIEFLSKPENHHIELKENLDSEFYTSWHSQTYIRAFIVNSLLQCEYCEYLFTDTCFLLMHESFHSPCRPYECFHCEIFCNNIKDINLHWQGECIFLREDFKTLQSFRRLYVCNVCHTKHSTLEMLQEHRQSKQHFFPRTNYYNRSKLCTNCELCGRLFYNVTELLAHYEENHCKRNRQHKEISSEKARTFLCEICGKSYTQSSHLWQHLRFHQGVKPFACTVDNCDRRFTIRPDLNDHIRKCHTGERPYHCLVCGKRFLTGSVFYQHRLIHRGERRYECDTCGKKFYRADALKNHSRIHTGEKPFECQFCTKMFRQRGDRDKHIRARHALLNPRSKLMMQMQKIELVAKAKKESADENTSKKSPQKKEKEATKRQHSYDY